MNPGIDIVGRGRLLWVAVALGLFGQGCETAEVSSRRYVDLIERSGKPAFWNAGLFECDYGEKTISTNSPTGYFVEMRNLRFKERTSSIPPTLGTTFGILYYVPNACTNANGRWVMSFPPIKNPETGKVFTNYVREGQWTKPGLSAMVYSLAEGYEAVSGRWTFEVFANDELCVQKKFTLRSSLVQNKRP